MNQTGTITFVFIHLLTFSKRTIQHFNQYLIGIKWNLIYIVTYTIIFPVNFIVRSGFDMIEEEGLYDDVTLLFVITTVSHSQQICNYSRLVDESSNIWIYGEST